MRARGREREGAPRTYVCGLCVTSEPGFVRQRMSERTSYLSSKEMILFEGRPRSERANERTDGWTSARTVESKLASSLINLSQLEWGNTRSARLSQGASRARSLIFPARPRRACATFFPSATFDSCERHRLGLATGGACSQGATLRDIARGGGWFARAEQNCRADNERAALTHARYDLGAAPRPASIKTRVGAPWIGRAKYAVARRTPSARGRRRRRRTRAGLFAVAN